MDLHCNHTNGITPDISRPLRAAAQLIENRSFDQANPLVIMQRMIYIYSLITVYSS